MFLEKSKWDDACNRGFKEWGNSNFLNSLIKLTDNRPRAPPPPFGKYNYPSDPASSTNFSFLSFFSAYNKGVFFIHSDWYYTFSVMVWQCKHMSFPPLPNSPNLLNFFSPRFAPVLTIYFSKVRLFLLLPWFNVRETFFNQCTLIN